MKNINTSLSAILILLMMINCSEDIIELQPKDKLTTSVILSNLDGVEGIIYGAYDRARSPYESRNICLYKFVLTDLVIPGTNITDQPIVNQYGTLQNFDASNGGVELLWNAYYQGLSYVNTILENIDGLEINEANEADIKRRDIVKGEAYFFRAYFHTELVQRWENIVLADHVFIDPGEELALADQADVYDMIISDLETAILLLPEAIDVGNTGKVTKGAARHLLSKVHMDLGNWSIAADYADQVIDDPGFSLESDPAKIFPAKYEDCPEIILAWQFTFDDANHRHELSTQFTPMYDRTNGVARTFEQGGRPWSRFAATDYVLNLYEEHDLRLEAWIKRYWIYDIDTPDDPLPEGVSIGDTVTAENVTSTNGRGMLNCLPSTKKHWEDGSKGRNINDSWGYKNIIQYRLAEAYMTAAEAYYREGDMATALSRINVLRNRAEVSEFTTLNDEIILDEHARELAHEGHRYPMLKRLGVLMERVQIYSPEIGGNMLPHHEYWPIPQVFVDLTKIRQNEGYE